MQASDLERLLSMYARWQQRIFDHSTFDVFLETLEKIGSTHQLKVLSAWPHSCCYWQLHSQRLCPTAVASVASTGLLALRCKCSAAAVGRSQVKLH